MIVVHVRLREATLELRMRSWRLTRNKDEIAILKCLPITKFPYNRDQKYLLLLIRILGSFEHARKSTSMSMVDIFLSSNQSTTSKRWHMRL